MQIQAFSHPSQLTQLQLAKLQAFLDTEQNELLLDSDVGQYYLFEENQAILAVVRLSNNPFHPYYLEIEFSIKPIAYHRLGDILTSLKQIGVKSNEHGFKVYLESPHPWHDTLISVGFREVLSGYVAEVDCQASLAALKHSTLPSGLTLYRYDALSDKQLATVNDFRLEGYFTTHQWDPPAPRHTAIWDEANLNDTNKALSYAVFSGERVVLTSDCLDENGLYLFSWMYFDTPDHRTILAAVLAKQLKEGRSHFIEVDNSDPFAECKAELLTLARQEVYQHYHWNLP